MATAAVFIALGGGAYAALAPNSVTSKQIKDGAVASQDIKTNALQGNKFKDGSLRGRDLDDETVTGAEVDDESLTGEDVDESTLYRSGAIGGQDTFAVPVAGILSGRINDIGTGGSVLFGAMSGRSVANADFNLVATGTPSNTVALQGFRAAVSEPMGIGESREFALMRRFSPTNTLLPSNVGCTIGPGEESCIDPRHTQVTNPYMGLQITNTGGGLNASDYAVVSVMVKANAPSAVP